MRTNIDIDDDLMAAAMEAGGFKTKKDAVEEGLRLVRRRKVYEGLLALRGQLQWDDADAAWARAGEESASPVAPAPRIADVAARKSVALGGKAARAGQPAATKRSHRA
jgi:Arc/MetJ family transcription regulator